MICLVYKIMLSIIFIMINDNNKVTVNYQIGKYIITCIHNASCNLAMGHNCNPGHPGDCGRKIPQTQSWGKPKKHNKNKDALCIRTLPKYIKWEKLCSKMIYLVSP
jgi:hypothetical protein